MNNILLRLEFFIQTFFRKQLFCPHCYSISIKTVVKKYKVIKVDMCNKCGLYFTNPIYKSIISNNFYDKMYWAPGLATTLPNAKMVSHLMRTNFIGTDRDFSERIRILRAIVKGNALLEFGSSWGYFLWQAKSVGFDVTGIEVSRPRAEYGRIKLNLDIRQSFNEIGHNTYDLIYTSHVLEHLSDLSTIFREFYNHLKQEGIFILEVPNFDFKQKGRSILPIIGAVHPLGFCPEFFTRNLPQYGFTDLRFFEDYVQLLDPTHHNTQGCQGSNIILSCIKGA